MLSLVYEDLGRPVEETARRLALALLDDADASLERLREGGDSEALHDFRVALRRLRSLLRAYRTHLEETASKKMRSRLKALATTTGLGRDTEVQLAWLDAQKDQLAARNKAGFKWLVKRLEARLHAAYAGVQAALADELHGIEKILRRRLSFYRVDVRGKSRAPVIEFSTATAERVQDQALELRAAADAFHSRSDQAALHKARICAKRLRYVLEPITPVFEGAAAAVDQLKAFQDLLGEVNDLHVLAAEFSSVGVDALNEEKGAASCVARVKALIKRELERLQGAIETEWLQGQIGTLVECAIGLATALEGERKKGIEIERKFLLHRVPPAADGIVPCEIDQGWIRGRSIEERVRRLREGDSVHYFRTVKIGTGLRRVELEDETDKSLFDALWPLTRGRRVRKRRYRIPESGLVWEIDKYSGRKLVLAEVELPSEDAPVEVPAWLAPHVVREVTGVEEFYNINLAR